MRLRLLAVLAIGLASSLTAQSQLVVKTFPNGYRDDNTAYFYQDHRSLLSLYFFTTDKPVIMKDAKLLIDLPEGLGIAGYGFLNSNNKYYDMKKNVQPAGRVSWELALENRPVSSKFAPTAWTVYSFYHVYVSLEPQPGFALKESSLQWRVAGGAFPEAAGTIPLKFLKAPGPAKKPKSFTVSTDIGYCSEILDLKDIDDWLAIAGNCGVTGIINDGLPNKYAPGINERNRQRIRAAKSFILIDKTALPYILDSRLPAALYPPEDKYYQLNLALKRARKPAEMLANSILWCPTLLATPDTPVFNLLLERIREQYRLGFTIFGHDYEKDIYTSCFCEYCLKSFAGYAGLAPAELPTRPLNLITKYPLEWYKFRAWQTGGIFNALHTALAGECPGIKFGIDASLSYPGMYTPGLGYGAI